MSPAHSSTSHRFPIGSFGTPDALQWHPLYRKPHDSKTALNSNASNEDSPPTPLLQSKQIKYQKRQFKFLTIFVLESVPLSVTISVGVKTKRPLSCVISLSCIHSSSMRCWRVQFRRCISSSDMKMNTKVCFFTVRQKRLPWGSSNTFADNSSL